MFVSMRIGDLKPSKYKIARDVFELSVYVCVKFRLGSERIQLPGLTSPSQRAGGCWLGHSLGEE